MPDAITVLLADDHALVRRGFRRLLEDEPDIEVVGEASTGTEALQLATRLRPQVIVMDYQMPELDGLRATRAIREAIPGANVIMLSMHADDHYVRQARDAGAKGYLLKNALDVDLPAAVRAVAAGGEAGMPAPAKDEDDSLSRLTPREREILTHIAQGKSNKEIAADLGLSVNTVSVHRANLMDALNIHKATELVVYAVRKGLITPP